MKRNIGYLDRGLRFFAGTVCWVAAFTRPDRDVWFGMLVIFGSLALVGALTAYSVLYAALGLATREPDAHDHAHSHPHDHPPAQPPR